MTACHDVASAPVAVAGIRRVALVGSPNAGKTSVFNQLTGLRAKTGNYPGVTVGRSVGTTKSDGVAIAVEDLPGTYSLDPISPDEQVVTDLLAGEYSDIDRPDALVLVADATTLRRSIMLVGQVLRLDLPCLLALTMGDELTSRGGKIDVEALSTALGIPVAAVVAHRGSGIDGLRAQLACFQRWQRPPILPPSGQEAIDAWGQSVLDAADYVAPQPDRRTHRIDRVLLHPLWGTIAFFAVMFWFFQVLFTAAAPLRDGIANGLTWLGVQVAEHVGNPVVRGLLSQGIIGGVGTVLQFIPQIVLLFCLLAFLENVGYMSRAAFLMDRVMAKTGLEGRAFVAMLSSFACAIPGIMATRTLPSSRDRIATIVTAPLTTCSARLPVYTLLVGLLVTPQTHWWGLSAQGVTMFLLYLGGGTSSLIAALVVKSTILRGDLLPFTMELPPYRMPSPQAMLAAMWSAAKVFLRKAGTIILATSLVLWALLNLPVREAADPWLVRDRCHGLCDEPQLRRRRGPRGRAGVRSAGLRLAHRCRPGRLAFGARSIRLNPGPGVGGDESRESAPSVGLVDRRAWPPGIHRTHGHRADDLFHLRVAVHVDDRGDAPRDQLVAMAGLRVLLHVCPRMGDGVCRPDDRARSGRMIPIHATATTDPQQLRWVIAADRMPPAGSVRRAPGRLGVLLDDGVISEMVVGTGGCADHSERRPPLARAGR